eukprot:m.173244 g.173244  ORF g.173244 m.173244 type:complete len:553 (+) comp31718_c0_seq1:121-1779(+)
MARLRLCCWVQWVAVMACVPVSTQLGTSSNVTIDVHNAMNVRPWLGAGYNVLNFDFGADSMSGLARDTFFKRWVDANASWARMVEPVPGSFWDFNETTWLPYGQLFRDVTHTTLYWTEFHPVLPNPDNTTALHAWARDNVVFLETLVVGHNMSNLEYFCFTNEEEGLNPRGNNTAWIAYAEAMRAALDVQGGAVANIKLVGTDYYPCDSAINGIANISAIDSYCCHNYGADEYASMQTIITTPVEIAHAHNKNFFLGEFGGPHQPRSWCNDACEWWDTPAEADAGIILAEKVLATINIGGQATGYWTFEDPLGGCPYWGLCKWNTTNTDPLLAFECRGAHYSHGLLSKFMRGPAKAYTLNVSGGDVVASFLQQISDGTNSIAVINLADSAIQALTVNLPTSVGSKTTGGTTYYRYTVEAAHPPTNAAGDLPPPVATVDVGEDGKLVDVRGLPARSVTIYTSFADDRLHLVPASVRCVHSRSTHTLLFDQPATSTVSYFRILTTQGDGIWSSFAPTFTLPDLAKYRHAHAGFAVQAIDRYGVASLTSTCIATV